MMGHGVAAALHTMHLSSLWTRYSQLLTDPVKFAAAVNDELSRVVQDESFATGVCGVIDARNKLVRFVGAGGPPILVYHADGQVEHLEASGLPFGILEDAPYEIVSSELAQRDRLLLFSDGAFEIHNAEGQMLGVEGLIRILETLGYPGSGIQANLLEQELLRYSNDIRLTDDVTFIEVQVK
ncbi:MAG: serine/threonine-protein phosphatase [Rhodopirellula sp.]|nr:serine/threonine-protein phosphatase [Rhodopirellula sp.]